MAAERNIPYQTLVWPDRWTCNCGAPDVPAPGTHGHWDVVRREALVHVASAVPPHTAVEVKGK
jgi:hypothetical protein